MSRETPQADTHTHTYTHTHKRERERETRREILPLSLCVWCRGGVRSRYASLPVYRGYDWWLKAYAEYNAFKDRPNANELITALPDDQ